VKGTFVPRVEIYTKTFCPYCWRAKHLLDSKGVDYVEVSVDFCGESKARMIERANGRRTVPQIFVAGQHIGGCDDLMALERAGKLDQIIAE
jgi:glutaredoxin 3